MNFMFGVILILSILSLLYYGIITIYAGFGTTFATFWLVMGVIGLCICDGIQFMMQHEVKLILIFRIIIFIVFILGIVIFTVIEVILLYYSNSQAEPGIDYIIILGAQVRGTKLCKALRRRLDTAIQYLIINPNTIAIVSGGQGDKEDISEAEAMSEYLINKGILVERILKEDRSRNTFENILYSKPFIRPKASVAIVTNGFHIFRAISIAKKQEIMNVQGIAAPTDKILFINYYVREAIGVIKDKLVGNI